MNNWQRVREQILDNYLRVPHEASDKAQYAERKSEGFQLIAHFVDTSIALSMSEGIEPEPRDAFQDPVREQANEAASVGRDIVFAFQYGKHDAIIFDSTVSEQKVKDAFSLSYGVPSHYLLAEARLGRRLLVDKDSLEEAIGRYLSNKLRPIGVDRLLVLSLTDMEISSYLAEMLDESRIIGQSPVQILRGIRAPIQTWFVKRMWHLIIFALSVLGLFVASSQGILTLEASGLLSLAFLAFFLLDAVLSLAKLPSLVRRHEDAKNLLERGVAELPALMLAFYIEFHTSGPISVKSLRARIEGLEGQGVVWPSSLWPLIDDIEKRGIVAL